MPSNIVLHKTNGHRHAPAPAASSPGEVLCRVHSAGVEGVRPTYDLLAFVSVARLENAGALVQQASREIDGLQMGLGDALARTEAGFQRGELADVRRALDACRQQADLAARMVKMLLASVELRSQAWTMLDVNAVVARAAATVADRAAGRIEVTTSLDATLPRVLGNPGQLERALVALVGCAAGAAGPAPRHVDVTTAPRSGVVSGDGIAEVRVAVRGCPAADCEACVARYTRANDPLLDERDLELYLACRTIREHGGRVVAAREPDGRRGLGVELPAA